MEAKYNCNPDFCLHKITSFLKIMQRTCNKFLVAEYITFEALSDEEQDKLFFICSGQRTSALPNTQKLV